MSEIFRTHSGPTHHAMTLRQLARAVHEAENSGDDISLLECWDELERRGGHRNATMSVFMDFYRELWPEFSGGS